MNKPGLYPGSSCNKDNSPRGTLLGPMSTSCLLFVVGIVSSALQRLELRAAEIYQWVIELAAKPENQSSIPVTHMVGEK